MKLKCSLLLSSFLLAGYGQAYVPDHSLKKAWTQELEDTQPAQRPYGLVFDLGSKRLIYIAAEPQNREKTNALIESLIEERKPQIVLLQGHVGDNIHPSKVKFKINTFKPILKGASASRPQILTHLASYGMSEKDYEMFKLLILLNQLFQFEVHSFQEVKKKALHHLKTDPNAKKLQITYEDVEKWFHDKMGQPMTERFILNGENISPKDPKLPSTNYLQKLSSYEDEVEDAAAMENLARALEEYDKVMVIRAGSKYVMERDVLHKMLGVSKPTEIIH